MKPLQSVALGLVIVVLTIRPWGGYDVMADPLAWVLVLLGVRRLPEDLRQRSTLLVLAGLAGVSSVVMFFPTSADRVLDADPSLWWGMSVPQLLFSTLLPWLLATRAADADDDSGRTWLRMASVLVGLSFVLPPIVFGGGLDFLEGGVYALASVAMLLLIVLLFAYNDRSWAGGSGGSDVEHAARR